MRSLRLFRSNSARSTEHAEENLDAGLMAFAPETPAEPGEVLVHPQTPAARVMFFVLLALVVLQAVPTFLWIKGRVRPPAAPPVVAAAPVAPPAAIVPAPPCEAAPAPAQPAPTPASSRNAATASAAAAAAAAAPPPMVAGLLAISTPVPMRVYLKGKLIGTTEAETIMLPAGSHELEFRNDDVGYSARRQVTVQAGRTGNMKLDMPPGTLHINAVPWADVSIDNKRVGETPIGNYQIAIGTHEVIFRHPDLGERRATVVVTAKEPARLSMDLRKK